MISAKQAYTETLANYKKKITSIFIQEYADGINAALDREISDCVSKMKYEAFVAAQYRFSDWNYWDKTCGKGPSLNILVVGKKNADKLKNSKIMEGLTIDGHSENEFMQLLTEIKDNVVMHLEELGYRVWTWKYTSPTSQGGLYTQEFGYLFEVSWDFSDRKEEKPVETEIKAPKI